MHPPPPPAPNFRCCPSEVCPDSSWKEVSRPVSPTSETTIPDAVKTSTDDDATDESVLSATAESQEAITKEHGEQHGDATR